MAEKRKHRRYRKRYTVRFGTEDLSKAGFTGDISKGGAFIVSNHLLPLDARVHLQVQLDAKNFVFFEGVVQRHRKVPPELRQVEPGGFGVRFLFPDEVVADVVNKDASGFELRFATPEQLRTAYERDLRMGGAFLVTDRVPRLRDSVQITLCLDFANAVVEQRATVVHINQDTGSARAGVSVMFNDRQGLEERLRPYLPPGAR